VTVPIPFYLGDLGHWHPFPLHLLLESQRPKLCPLPIYVEIFMQAIDNKIKELLCILLPVYGPFLIQPSAEISE
jgi:hypothetical protein